MSSQERIAQIDAELAKLEGTEKKTSKSAPLEMDPAVENIINVAFPFALSPTAIKGAVHVARKAAKGIKNFLTPDKLSRLKHNPELKKKVIEKIAQEARPAKYGNVPNQVAGEKVLKSAKNYKEKSEKTFGNLFGRAKTHLDKHITGEKKGNRFVDSTDAEMFAINKMLALESPTLQAEFIKGPLGKQLQKFMKVKREGRKLTVGEAEQIRRDIGDINSTAGAIGTGSQGELRKVSGLLKKEIANKYKEAGRPAERAWERSHKHYTLHKEKNVPKTNEMLKHQHEPEAAFAHSVKGLGAGASNLRHTGQYLSPKDKKVYFKGVVFDLGKKADNWDATTFYKNFGELPSKNKKLILSSIGKKEASRLKALEQQLKTMDSLGGKKSGLDIAGEFAPNGIKKWKTPIKTLRQNNYLKPEQVSAVTSALKKKSNPTIISQKPNRSFDARMIPGLFSDHKKEYDVNDRIAEIDRKIAELEGTHYHAEGDVVKPGTRDPYDSDKDDPDSGPDEDYAIVGHKNYGRFAINHIMTDRGEPLQRRVVERGNRRVQNERVSANTVMAMTPKWRNRLFREFKKPEFQQEFFHNQNAETKRPIKMKVLRTNNFGNYPPYEDKGRLPMVVSAGKKHHFDFTHPFTATVNTPLIIHHLDHVRPKF